MDESVYGLREFRPQDYVQEAQLWASYDPCSPSTPEEIQRWHELFFKPPYRDIRWVAELSSTGVAVGLGSLNNDPESFDEGTFWESVIVDEAHRGRGIGYALAMRLEHEAGRLRARRLWTQVRADEPRSIRFFTQQGFTERRRRWRSRLEVAEAHLPSDRTEELVRSGFSFLTAADLDLSDQATLSALYALNLAVSVDEPRIGPYTATPVEQFVEAEFRGPAVLPEAFFLARYQGQFVALTAMRRVLADPTVLHQSFTGTRREHRGKGIATELKRRTLEYARSRGYRTIVTGNDSLNQPMLAINRKLGFRMESERIDGERFRPAPASYP